MTLDDIPIFAAIKNRMDYITQRQSVIGQNIANSDTPGYTPSDLKPFTLAGASGGMAQVQPTMTSPMHMSGTVAAQGLAKPVDAPDSETTLNGNSVVLEDQMMKLTQARMDYDAAVGFYQKSISLLQLAARRPGS